mmetsp:Transcript_121241/g.220520  ORF Transcript_121241/g.220520 Transcript_121241/m.220520 type:complete len:456 (-) Transcript_121241:282-1649(-)
MISFQLICVTALSTSLTACATAESGALSDGSTPFAWQRGGSGQPDLRSTCCTDGSQIGEDQLALLQLQLTSHAPEPKASSAIPSAARDGNGDAKTALDGPREMNASSELHTQHSMMLDQQGNKLEQALSNDSRFLPQMTTSSVLHGLHLRLLETAHQTASLADSRLGSSISGLIFFLVLFLLFALCACRMAFATRKDEWKPGVRHRGEPYRGESSGSDRPNSLKQVSRQVSGNSPPSSGSLQHLSFLERVAVNRQACFPPDTLLKDLEVPPICSSLSIPAGSVCQCVIPNNLENMQQSLSFDVGASGNPLFRIHVNELGSHPGIRILRFHSQEELAFMSTECLWGMMEKSSFRIYRPNNQLYCSVEQNSRGGYSVLHGEGELMLLSGDFTHHVIWIRTPSGRDLASTSQLSPYEYEVRLSPGADPVVIILALLAVDKCSGPARYKAFAESYITSL